MSTNSSNFSMNKFTELGNRFERYNPSQYMTMYLGGTGTIENQLGTQARSLLNGTGARIYPFTRQAESELTSLKQKKETRAKTAADQINFIQAALGITISHLALTLGVERQTIYNWMQSETPPVLQARPRDRLNLMYEFARQWTTRSTRPANKLIATLNIGDGTLLDLLKQPELDQGAILAGLDIIADHIATTIQNKRKVSKTSVIPPDSSDERILGHAASLQFRLDGEE